MKIVLTIESEDYTELHTLMERGLTVQVKDDELKPVVNTLEAITRAVERVANIPLGPPYLGDFAR